MKTINDFQTAASATSSSSKKRTKLQNENDVYDNNGVEPAALFACNIRSTCRFLDLKLAGLKFEDVLLKKAMRRVFIGESRERQNAQE